jgi:NAD(P)-dependent dehydrogenase (short-subunit alcohol dehydrogenase family)
MDQLSGKVAVVTGAASGIGLAMAEAFAAEGMRLVLADVDEAGMAAALSTLTGSGAEAIAVPTDVSDPSSVEALRDETLSSFRTAHVICNNAGVGGGGPLWEVPLEVWQWVFGVNFWGVVHGIRSFVPLLLEQGEGHVVNTASAAGLLSTPFLGPYSASKHAVVATSETLRLDLAGRGVGVSVLCPMWVRTRIHDSDRNAPESVTSAQANTARDPATADSFRSLLAGLVGSGLEPSVVASDVVSAVKEDRFWVLPHPEAAAAAEARGRQIGSGENPRFDFGALFG